MAERYNDDGPLKDFGGGFVIRDNEVAPAGSGEKLRAGNAPPWRPSLLGQPHGDASDLGIGGT